MGRAQATFLSRSLLLTQQREAPRATFCSSMANKVEDDHRDGDGERGDENDTENSAPHASRCVIIGVKFAQHYHSRSCATTSRPEEMKFPALISSLQGTKAVQKKNSLIAADA
jgi:hypothetical protein